MNYLKYHVTMINFPQSEELKRGVLIFGSLADHSTRIAQELSHRYNATLYTYIKDSEVLDEAAQTEFFTTYNFPEDQRKYSVIHADQKHLYDSALLMNPLILEARPLRVIFVIELTAISELTEEQRNILFGNIPNFVVGNLSMQEKELLNDLTNNAISEDMYPEDHGSTSLLSYLTDGNSNRKTILFI